MFDLNCNVEHLAFVVNGSNIFAKRKNEETGRLEPITRETFAAMVNDVKTQCSGTLTLTLSSLCLFCMYVSKSFGVVHFLLHSCLVK